MPNNSPFRIWVGTRKGAFVFSTKDRKKWDSDGPFVAGHPAGVYFGTSTGTVFYTRDAGDSWHILAEHLPPIYSVSASFG
jgi:hypothetical protein